MIMISVLSMFMPGLNSDDYLKFSNHKNTASLLIITEKFNLVMAAQAGHN